MFHYIDQPRTPPFPIGLVKAESDFVRSVETFLESNSPDILALCETNLHESIDSGNFSVRGHIPLI